MSLPSLVLHQRGNQLEGIFKVATYNCNSIRARLELVLEWLQREAADVLCLQETKVQDAEFPLVRARATS